MPEKLVKFIREGQVYNHQFATAHMNAFLKEHIYKITNDYYPTNEEYQIIKDQLINRLQMMGIRDTALYEVRYFYCHKCILPSPLLDN